MKQRKSEGKSCKQNEEINTLENLHKIEKFVNLLHAIIVF